VFALGELQNCAAQVEKLKAGCTPQAPGTAGVPRRAPFTATSDAPAFQQAIWSGTYAAAGQK